MARRESDREDLLREATALVDRAELRVAGELDPVTVGFRQDGSLSLYFGADPVYQFNAAGQLRRAFVSGLLYKAEQGRLVELRRERNEREVVLARHDVIATDGARFLADLEAKLHRLQTALAERTFELVGEISARGDVAERAGRWLAALPRPIVIASRPNL